MIKFVIFDFDGVFTDSKVYFDNSKNILKYYNVKDGKAINLLKKNNIKTGLISSFNSTLLRGMPQRQALCRVSEGAGIQSLRDLRHSASGRGESRNTLLRGRGTSRHTNNNLLLNEKSIIENINEHLKFDYFYIGCNNKLNTLNNWLEEEQLTYDNIAYIGDDLVDIPILKKVNFSSCPNDAVNECKNVVDYICEKKGGYGCVREFVDKILKDKMEPNLIQEIKNEINYQMDSFNLNDVEKLVNLIEKCKGTIYMTGVGKSSNIAKHCSDLLKSISVCIYYFNPMNLLHGDIGTINSEDLIVMFSKSGNTIELIQIIPFLKERKCYIVGVCCNKNSKFKENCDLVIETPFKNEISGEINKIPTNSYLSHLLFSNMLVSLLKQNITLDEYKENHPSGNIGKNLKKIKDCLIYDYPKIVLENNILLCDILLQMTNYKIGCCFFINENNKLLGILTDGDIRRLILRDDNIKYITINDVNKNYYYETNINKYIYEYNKKYNYIPILQNKKILGIIVN